MTVAFATGFASTRDSQYVSAGSFTKFLPKVEVVQEEMKPRSLSFVGDIMLARRVETYLDAYGSDYAYSNLPEVSSSTVLFGNFEAAIPEVHKHTPDLTFSFSVDEQHIPALRAYGFQYMSLANNHAFDKGSEGFVNTTNVLSEQGLKSFGVPDELGTTSIAYVELAEKTVAVIGLHALGKKLDSTSLKKIFEKASEQTELQIVYVHWGTEYQPVHSKAQSDLAHTLVEMGAEAVIGHHPHVVQDIELYKGVPIFYSLGNFIFDQYFSTEVQEGLWVEMEVAADNSVEYTLKGVTSIGSWSVPRFMSAYENDVFLQTLAKKSTKSIYEQIENGKITQ